MKQFFIDADGTTHELPDFIEPKYPLSPIGVIATLNAVLGIWSLSDAASASGYTEEQLILEAQAWALGVDNGN